MSINLWKQKSLLWMQGIVIHNKRKA